jgi:hypothetical protein
MITHEKSYTLGTRYEIIKEKVSSLLEHYTGDIIHFDDYRKKLSFKTETLIPVCDPAKPNILLLFSNPHPGSVKTGMFLCAEGNKPHQFWWFMRDAGWFDILNIDYVSENLKSIFLSGRHEGPFNLFFDCFYDFPSEDPEDLTRMFGEHYFTQEIVPAARTKLKQTIIKNEIDAIVSFSGRVTSQLINRDLDGYTTLLNEGQLLKFSYHADDQSQRDIPVYQSYPAGHHVTGDLTRKRHQNLIRIREDIFLDTLRNETMSLEAIMISEPSVLLRIRQFYSPDLSPIELYDVTRGRWRIGKKREEVHLAFSIYRHTIIEVYEVAQWFPAGTTFSTRKDAAPPDRWEFVGNIARVQYREKYINKSVAHYFPTGARNPVRYINL